MNKKPLIILGILTIIFISFIIGFINYSEEESCRMNNYEGNNLTYPINLEFGFGEYNIGCPEYTKNKFTWGSVFSR